MLRILRFWKRDRSAGYSVPTPAPNHESPSQSPNFFLIAFSLLDIIPLLPILFPFSLVAIRYPAAVSCRFSIPEQSKRCTKPKEGTTLTPHLPIPHLLLEGRPHPTPTSTSRHTRKPPNFILQDHLCGRRIFKPTLPLEPLSSINRLRHLCRHSAAVLARRRCEGTNEKRSDPVLVICDCDLHISALNLKAL